MSSFPFGKLLLFLGLFVYFLAAALHPASWHIIDGMNLLVHEAGHVIFAPFGSFMHTLGGSLFQIIIPSIFIAAFWRQDQLIETGAMFLWLGQSLINVSVYIADAPTMQLPLLGDDPSMHDWHNLFNMTNAMSAAPTIAFLVHACGFLAIAASLFFVIKEIRRRI